MSQTLELRDMTQGRKGTLAKFRTPSNAQEIIEHCERNSHIMFLSTDGTARSVKINGKVRTWKRSPERIEVPIKYGLYEYGTFTLGDIERILIPVSPSPESGIEEKVRGE